MLKASRNEQYAAEIYDLLIHGFDDENEDQRWNLENLDATAWFTGLVKASAMIYNKLADDEKNFIDYTHLCQNLLIQDMMKNKDAA